MNTVPKVFISYSWDNEDHKAWVLNLAKQLIANGVDVILDQFELSLGKNLSHFMEKAVVEADKVLLILTENYKIKAEDRKGGAGYEYSMINSELYRNQTDNKKFLPIVRGKERATSIPIFVNAFIDLDMRVDEKFEEQLKELLHAIYEKPKVVKPTLGKRPDFLNQPTTTQPPKQDKPDNPSISDQINAAKTNHTANKDALNQKQQLRHLVATNKTKQVLQKLEEIAQNIGDNDLGNTIILLSSQFEDNAKQRRMGIATPESLRITLNRINASLLELIGNL